MHMVVQLERICLLSCLAFACFLLFAALPANELSPSEHRSRILAADALHAARQSVRVATLREAQKNELQPHPGDSKLERLQASLGNVNVTWPCLTGTELCASLAGKRVTMIGGEHIYQLHRVLLQHQERVEKKPFPCHFHEFCTHHHICLPFHHSRDPRPAGPSSPRYVKPPTAQDLIKTSSSAVNYIVSDTLFAAANASSWEYHLPYVDPTTGVRLRETYWLQAARKANVVILGRGPLSAPGQTYTGNWSFLLDDGGPPITSAYKDRVDGWKMPGPRAILNAAVHLTVSRFLPDLVQLLQAIRQEVRPSTRKCIIWPSDWYRLPGRGSARTALLRRYLSWTVQEQKFLHTQDSAERMFASQLSAFIHADATNTAHSEDPWTLLFNAQGELYLENMVLKEVLPQYGFVFLPLNTPWVEGVRSRGHGRVYSDDDATNSVRSVAIGQKFLAGLDVILRYFE